MSDYNEDDFDDRELEPIRPQPGKQELALNIDADVIFYGGAAGSAKSHTALMRSLRHIQDPHYNPVYFRRTTEQLTGQGGLWPEAKAMYRRFGAKAREQAKAIRFPNGCEIVFDHLQHEKDAEGNHLGLQYSAVFFDELPTFSESQFMFLLSRLRSKAKMSPYAFCTMNPDYDSWVYNWVEWYINEDGLPNEDRCGTIRYFVTVDGKPVFGNTVEELEKEYPHLCWINNPKTGIKRYVRPKSFVFISANIFDNQKLIDSQPEYLASLMAMDEVKRARFLYGNWKARVEGNAYFKRDWLHKVDTVPLEAIHVRAWDKASSEPSPKEWHPDYTAGSPRISKCRDGYYWLYWGFHEDIRDPDSDVTGRFRKIPGERDALIEKQAQKDGKEVFIVFSQDPGGAGKTEFEQSAAKLTKYGYMVLKDPVPSNKGKLSKFTPFSVACQSGLVRIVEDSFPNKTTLEAFYKELENFTGERSTRQRHDDWADATASAFNALSQQNYCPVVVFNQIDSPSLVRDVLYNRDLY